MEEKDVLELNTLNSLQPSDLLHVLRVDEFSSLLSYKGKASALSNVFQDAFAIESFKSSISALLGELGTLSSSMLTRTTANEIYASKDHYDNEKAQLLTTTELKTITSMYVTEDILKAKTAELIVDSRKLADEMTDFGGAAMVGINQSASSSSEE